MRRQGRSGQIKLRSPRLAELPEPHLSSEFHRQLDSRVDLEDVYGRIEQGRVSAVSTLASAERARSSGGTRTLPVSVVAGDPIADITELQRVCFVMKDGRVVRNDLSPSKL